MFRANCLVHLTLGGLLTIGLSGCSDFESSFVYSARTASLITEAQTGTAEGPGVKPLVDEKFGDPQHLKAWLKLPIDFGGSLVSVVDVVRFRLVADEGQKLPESASSLQFHSGELESTAFQISKWDSKSGDALVILQSPLQKSPKAGDKCSVDSGDLKFAIAEFAMVNKEGTIKLVAAEGAKLPESATGLQFVTGDAAGTALSISSWDITTGEATLASLPEKAPKAGDTCSIDGGSVLSQGRVLYMRHCSHCHGTSGDGNGPTAQYLNPRPRDYRLGKFKFTSTVDVAKASREDLTRVLKYGIPGTYMPSFLLMEESELHAIVEYVRFLAMRGEYEDRLVTELVTDFSVDAVRDRMKGENGDSRSSIVKELNEFLAADMKDSSATIGDALAEIWTTADTPEAMVQPSVSRVEDSEASRQRGRDLFLTNCASCHGIDGAGNGPQTIAYEKKPGTNDVFPEAGLHDDWGNLNQPRNLKTGIFRGGRRPIDVFCRIHAGIKGSRMPSFKNLPHEDIWHMVNYVLSVQFESEPGASGVPIAAPAPATTAGL